MATLGVINIRWLISNHLASITMATLLMGFVFGSVAGLAMTPLVGLLFSSRIYLKRHTIWQAVGGMFVGAACALAVSTLGYF